MLVHSFSINVLQICGLLIDCIQLLGNSLSFLGIFCQNMMSQIKEALHATFQIVLFTFALKCFFWLFV